MTIRIQRAGPNEYGLEFLVIDAETGEDLTRRIGAVSVEIEHRVNEPTIAILRCYVDYAYEPEPK